MFLTDDKLKVFMFWTDANLKGLVLLAWLGFICPVPNNYFSVISSPHPPAGQ